MLRKEKILAEDGDPEQVVLLLEMEFPAFHIPGMLSIPGPPRGRCKHLLYLMLPGCVCVRVYCICKFSCCFAFPLKMIGYILATLTPAGV